MKNPNWERDELILALDLYFRHNPIHISDTHPEVIKLSETLNRLPIHETRPDAAKFRNPNGVYMKLCNFLRFDPSYHGKGLQRGSKQEQVIWSEFATNPAALKSVAKGIIDGVKYPSQTTITEDEDENEFPEGKVLYRRHKYFERNRSIVRKIKERAIKNGVLKCSACNFDFNKTYGELGKGYIECHHTVPISEYGRVKKTRDKDLVLVCSNCHRMLHRRRPWLNPEELMRLLPPSNKGKRHEI